MAQELKQRHSHDTYANGPGPQAGTPPHDYRYDGSQGSVARFITPGGNPIDNSQPAFPGKFQLPHQV